MNDRQSVLSNARAFLSRKRNEFLKKRKALMKAKSKSEKADLKFLQINPPKNVRSWFLPFLRPKTFWRGGLAAVYEELEPAIKDEAYRKAYNQTLAEYMWNYYHRKDFFHSIKWMGVNLLKSVNDLWVYQEIIYETRPDVIIEIGSLYGGSTLFLAQLLEILGKGRVISVDISRYLYNVSHPRIQTITGDCSSPAVVEEVKSLTQGQSVMLIHDGDHSESAVLRDLILYSPFVTKGCFIIVEDGIIELFNPNRLKVEIAKSGPLMAAERFLKEHPGEYEVAKDCERFLITSNPRGYLRKLV